MTYEIKTSKETIGWVATTELVIEENDNVQRILIASTWKPTERLATNLRVVVRKNQDGFVTESYPLYRGFHKTINAVNPCIRATEKDILQFHENVLHQIDEYVKEARAFYANSAPEIEFPI